MPPEFVIVVAVVGAVIDGVDVVVVIVVVATWIETNASVTCYLALYIHHVTRRNLHLVYYYHGPGVTKSPSVAKLPRKAQLH